MVIDNKVNGYIFRRFISTKFLAASLKSYLFHFRIGKRKENSVLGANCILLRTAPWRGSLSFRTAKTKPRNFPPVKMVKNMVYVIFNTF